MHQFLTFHPMTWPQRSRLRFIVLNLSRCAVYIIVSRVSPSVYASLLPLPPYPKKKDYNAAHNPFPLAICARQRLISVGIATIEASRIPEESANPIEPMRNSCSCFKRSFARESSSLSMSVGALAKARGRSWFIRKNTLTLS